MKKYILMIALIAVSGAYGFSRQCGLTGKKNYSYVLVVLTAQEEGAGCYVYLTAENKNFIKNVLSKFDASTYVTRDFYLNNIKSKFSSATDDKAKDNEAALRRVVRDFGGSEKTAGEKRRIMTVGDIRQMLDGKLKSLTTVLPY